MRRQTPPIARRIAVLAVLVALASGCATAIRAQVVDARTGQPIPGAVVLGVWTKVDGMFGHYSHRLVGVRETVTDEAGRFELERLPSSGLDGEGGGQSVTVYKFGHVTWSNRFRFPASERRDDTEVPRRIPLEAFPAGASHRRHLDFIEGAIGPRVHEAQAPRFFEAIRQEGRFP